MLSSNLHERLRGHSFVQPCFAKDSSMSLLSLVRYFYRSFILLIPFGYFVTYLALFSRDFLLVPSPSAVMLSALAIMYAFSTDGRLPSVTLVVMDLIE